MTDGQKKLFDPAEALDGDTAENNNTRVIGDTELKAKSNDNDNVRFEELYYAERYRQRIRRGKRTPLPDDTEERVAKLRESEEKIKREAMEREESETKAHSDRISELLSRIENMNRGEEIKKEDTPSPVADDVPSSPAKADKPDSEEVNPTDSSTTTQTRSDNVSEHIISINTGVLSEILHIDGVTLTHGDESLSLTDTYEQNTPFVPLKRNANQVMSGESPAPVKQNNEASDFVTRAGAVYSTMRAFSGYPDPEGARYADPVGKLYADPERTAYPDTERRFYSDPEGARYADPVGKLYTDPERTAYADTERRLYSDPEGARYADPVGKLYTDPERTAYADTERRLYSDPEGARYADPVGKLYTDPERELYPDPYMSVRVPNEVPSAHDVYPVREADTSSPYPELDSYGQSEELYSQDTLSPYPEAQDKFIKRQKAGAVPQYVPKNAYDTRMGINTYPDPENAVQSDAATSLDELYPDPVSQNQMSGRPLSRREKKEARRREKRLAVEDALRFERELRDGTFTSEPSQELDKTVYDDVRVGEYPDPEHLAFGTGARDADEYISDVGKSIEGYDTQTSEVLNDPLYTEFKPRALRRFISRSVSLDLKRIKEKYKYKMRELKLELRGSELRFSDRKDKNVRAEREIESDISALRRECRREKKRARTLLHVCRNAVLTNFATAKIKKRADRAALVELRSELLHLITEKYHLDERLISIYTGEDTRESYDGRFSAEMKGKRRAHRQQRRIEREMEAGKVSPAYTKKIYPLMDELVTLSGELERVNYSLKREHPRGAVKRELKRQRRKLRRKTARLRDNIDYYKKRGLDHAEDKRVLRRNTILGWLALGIVVAIVVLVCVFWGDITAFFASFGAQ